MLMSCWIQTQYKKIRSESQLGFWYL